MSALILSSFIFLTFYKFAGQRFSDALAFGICIAFLGFFNQRYGMLHKTHDWMLFTYSGVVRATSELFFGCVCYTLSRKIASFRLGRTEQCFFRIAENSCFIAVIFTSWFIAFSGMDFIYLIVLALGIAICLGVEQKSWRPEKILAVLGRELSLSLYLNHLWILYIIKDIHISKNTKITVWILLTVLVSISIRKIG